MIVIILLLLQSITAAFDENDIKVPPGYHWVCDTISPFHQSPNTKGTLRVSEDGSSASELYYAGQILVLGTTPLVANRTKGDNKYFFALNLGNSNNRVGVSQNVYPSEQTDYDIGTGYERLGKEAILYEDVNNTVYMMVDMDEATITYDSEPSRYTYGRLTRHVPALKNGVWYLTVVFEEHLTILHHPRDCPEFGVLPATKALFEDLAQRLFLREETIRKMREATTLENKPFEKNLIQASFADPARLQSLSEIVGNDTQMGERDIVRAVVDIAMTPQTPSGYCTSNYFVQMLSENWKIGVIRQIVQLSVYLSSTTTDEKTRATFQEHIRDAILAYPLEDATLREDYLTPLRETVYGKLSEMRSFLRKAPSLVWSQVLGEVSRGDFDSFFDHVMKESLEAVAKTMGKRRDSPYVEEKFKEITELEAKYSNIL